MNGYDIVNTRCDHSRKLKSYTTNSTIINQTFPSTKSTWKKHRSRGINALVLLLASSGTAMAQGCVSLRGSTECPAFSAASISTNSTLVGFYPFLQGVSDTASFDKQMRAYLQTSYVQEQYANLLGCSNIDLSNTTNLYARFTATVMCNGIVQNSIVPCGLTGVATKPVCAETCAQFAESEAYIVADNALCSSPGPNANAQLRAHFTDCALPVNALSTSNCITGIQNEPDNCGYGNATLGLCTYCGSGGINSTDTCCYQSDISSRCAGVVLPSITPNLTLPTSTTSPTSSATNTEAAAASNGSHLSGGAIAGIAIGSFLAMLLLGALLAFCCTRLLRRKNGSQQGSIFNQPSPARQGPAMAQAQKNAPPGYGVLPGGRIARMSALEDGPAETPAHAHGAEAKAAAAGVGVGAAGGYAARRESSSDEFRRDHEVEPRTGMLHPPPVTNRRQGSLSSSSVLGANDELSSPSNGAMSSPAGMGSTQSEQLPFFKDYYSQGDIHPGDAVAALWAYRPRAPDEVALERGDMLKVVGIWDDGWATGVLMNERADDWDARPSRPRDSGVSNGSEGRDQPSSPAAAGEIRAFPLVCVCLPEHWRKIIEGDGSTESGSTTARGGYGT